MTSDRHQTLPVSTSVVIFAALLILLFMTIGAAYLDLGPLAVPIAFTIATIKALLIVFYFMHVKFSSTLIKLFSMGASLWVVILLVFTLSDYLGRDLLNIVGK